MSLVEVKVDGRIALCTLNRPEARNALSPELRAELAEEVTRLDADAEIRCIVITGNDEAFAAGADVKALLERGEAPPGAGADFWRTLEGCETPLVAAVSGWALGGGCELALLCDLIIASEDAEFGQPEITLGIIPGAGGTQRLARLVGKQRAMELVLTGRRFDAKEAEQMGLVNQIVPRGKVIEKATELAEVIARRPPLAVKLAKQAVLTAEETALSDGLGEERRMFDQALATEDATEGITAFLDKRKPEFKGR